MDSRERAAPIARPRARDVAEFVVALNLIVGTGGGAALCLILWVAGHTPGNLPVHFVPGRDWMYWLSGVLAVALFAGFVERRRRLSAVVLALSLVQVAGLVLLDGRAAVVSSGPTAVVLIGLGYLVWFDRAYWDRPTTLVWWRLALGVAAPSAALFAAVVVYRFALLSVMHQLEPFVTLLAPSAGLVLLVSVGGYRAPGYVWTTGFALTMVAFLPPIAERGVRVARDARQHAGPLNAHPLLYLCGPVLVVIIALLITALVLARNAARPPAP